MKPACDLCGYPFDYCQCAVADKLEVGIDYWKMLADRRGKLLRECKKRIESDLSFHRHHYVDLLAEIVKELGDVN